MLTFKHSGDLGDIIFSLPTIRALGGGVLYLDPNGGKGSPLVQTEKGNRTKLNSDSIDSIKNLLLLQSYIKDVKKWSGEKVDYDLDEFRKHIRYNNLADSHLAAFGLKFNERDEKWLDVLSHTITYPIIFSRSCRYQGNHSYWAQLAREITNNHFFIGHKKEHELFEFTFDTKINYQKTPTLLDVAKELKSSMHLYCNQSVVHAIAEGLKINLTQEVYRPYPATLFNRPGASYV